MTTRKTILILGGSYAGISAAHYTLKHVVPALPDPDSYEVAIASASHEVLCRPACPRAMIAESMFAQDKLFVDIPGLFASYPAGRFRFVHGSATSLDHASRIVTVTLAAGGTEALAYHALVIATGASTPSPLHGLNGGDSAALRARWVDLRTKLSSARTIVVGGGGPAGVETAGELGEHLNGRCGTRSAPKVRITLVTGAAEILPHLRPALARKAEAYLANVGVTVVRNRRVVSVAPEGAGVRDVASAATLSLDDGSKVSADLYIPATGMRPNADFAPAAMRAPDGRIAADPATLRVIAAGDRVYALGDVSAAARPAVHNVLNTVPVLGANMKCDLLLAVGVPQSKVPASREFKEDTREMQLVPIGRSKGVGAAMGWALPSWLVWLIKGRDYWLWTVGRVWSGKQWAKES